jgi:hypothetical protein
MKPIDTTTGEDRAVSALLGKAATLACGVTMKLLGPSSGLKPRRGPKPTRGKRGPRVSRVKGGLHHG